MATKDALIAELSPLAAFVATLDLSKASEAQAALATTFPLASLAPVAALAREARDEGWLTPREATPTLRFGRLAKPSPSTHNLSIDVVDMSGAGAPHTHPNGEVSLCFTESGQPKFCGEPEGWVVVPPGSRHTPEVTDGHMLILYFLPEGAMTWG